MKPSILVLYRCLVTPLFIILPLLFLIAPFALIGQSTNFNITTEYKGCNTVGEVRISPKDLSKKYQYIMMGNDCGYALRPGQDSGIFTGIPPCLFDFKIISSTGDTTILNSIKLGMKVVQLTDSNYFKCDSTISNSSLVYYYIQNGHKPFTVGIKNITTNNHQVLFNTKDSIFSVLDTFKIHSGNLFVLYVKDSCGDEVNATMVIASQQEIDRQVPCDNSQIFSFPVKKYFLDSSFPGANYTWSINDSMVSNTPILKIIGRPKANSKVSLKIKVASCERNSIFFLPDENITWPAVRIVSTNKVICNNDSVLVKVKDDSSSATRFAWDNGLISDSIWIKKPGQYSFIAQNEKGSQCDITSSVIISQSIPRVSSSVTQNLCFAESNGKIELTASGGITPYTYAWNDREVTKDRGNLNNGNYSVKVKDSAGCSVSASFNINSPPPLLLSVSVHAADCIPAHNGKVSSVAGGGVPPYRYTWNNGLTVSAVDTLSPGSYTITLIDSNLCTRPFSFRVDNLNPFRSARVDTLCANTSLKIGTSNYTTSGRYTDSLKSTKGCDSIVTTYLTVNAPVDFTIKATDPICNGAEDGSLSITDIKGYPVYTYSLNDKIVSLSQFSKIAAGNYVVKVKDRFNCIKEKGFALTNPEKINFSLGRDTIIPYGDTLSITPMTNLKGSLIKQISWSTSPLQINCILCNTVYKYRPTDDHTLKATIESITGCKVSDDINIKINHDFKVYVPNIFMPSQASHSENQLLTIHGGKLVDKINYFRIFNRYGDEVYEAQNFAANDRSAAWDGKFKGHDAPQDVYVYAAEVVFADGSVRIVKGDVVLVR